jgi:hypothetical protein
MLLRIENYIFNYQCKDSGKNIVYAYHKLIVKLNQPVYFWKVDRNNMQEEDSQRLQVNETEGKNSF